jgi:cobalt/nickel transport system ATP-binding protein
VNRRIADGSFRPAVVVGVPVGFVGAAEAKDELLRVSAQRRIPAIVLRGERGGAAVAAAAVNALRRLAERSGPDVGSQEPKSHLLLDGEVAASLMLIGHGTRSPDGQAELRRFACAVAAARPTVPVAEGFIEFMEPELDEALDRAVSLGSGRVVAVPLVLLGAGHLKDDGPAALTRARARHPMTHLSYARDLGVHPAVLGAVSNRIREAGGPTGGTWGPEDAVIVVGRGSSDPDANADLMKAARLLADGRGLGSDATEDRSGIGLVEGAFVSLARPGVIEALDRCRQLGARRITVVPYFLFTGLLVERIGRQARSWAERHADTEVAVASHIGVDPGLVELVWRRFDEAAGGPVHMNCDGCLHRIGAER